MLVCNCNPFSEKDVENYLATKAGQKVRLRDVYRACTGGAKPPCGIACIDRLEKRLEIHNSAIGDTKGAVENSLEGMISPVEP